MMEKQEQKNKMFNELVKVVKAVESHLFILTVSVIVMVLGHMAAFICTEMLGFDNMWTRTTVVCIWRVSHNVVAILINRGLMHFTNRKKGVEIMRLYRGTKELESTAGRYWTSDIEVARSYGHIVYRVDLVSTDPEVSNLIVGTDQAYPMYDITSYRIDFYAADWWAYRLDSDRAVNVFTNRAIVHEYDWLGR